MAIAETRPGRSLYNRSQIHRLLGGFARSQVATAATARRGRRTGRKMRWQSGDGRVHLHSNANLHRLTGHPLTHHGRHHEGKDEAYQCLLPQQPRPPCTRGSALRLCQHQREPSRSAHQSSAEGEARKVHPSHGRLVISYRRYRPAAVYMFL